MEAKVALKMLFLFSILLIQGSYVEGVFGTSCIRGRDTRPACNAANSMKRHARRICSTARGLDCDQILRDDYSDHESQEQGNF
ncbi:unnamed protein product [Pocillopora meandrina]|uniref:Secreted protein n=1 Tax=Pocillopora meandrina TaxID=46732 RepID=A0AAU9X990_9CNID|nr:unnamed protein product [Pocillopora meandrina]